MNTPDYEVRFEGAQPGSGLGLDLGGLSQLMRGLQAAINATAHLTNEAPDSRKVTLVGAETGSVVLKLAVAAPVAMGLLVASVGAGDVSRLPAAAVAALREVSDGTRRTGTRVRLAGLTGDKRVAVIDAEHPIRVAASAGARGEATIRGVVRQAGGAEPKAVIVLESGERFEFKVNQRQAAELGKLLYQPVALTGVATWSASTYQMTKFVMRAARVLAEKSIETTFDEFRRAAGGVFDGQDVADILGRVRGAGDGA